MHAPGREPVLAALRVQLERLIGIGLGYLTLDRATSTLSGGESRRVKLVRHLGSSLTDLTYVFDEPTVGLVLTGQFRPHLAGETRPDLTDRRPGGVPVPKWAFRPSRPW